MRTNKALAAIANLEKCANRTGYEFTPPEVDKIVTAVLAAANRLRPAFEALKPQQTAFTL